MGILFIPINLVLPQPLRTNGYLSELFLAYYYGLSHVVTSIKFELSCGFLERYWNGVLDLVVPQMIGILSDILMSIFLSIFGSCV